MKRAFCEVRAAASNRLWYIGVSAQKADAGRGTKRPHHVYRSETNWCILLNDSMSYLPRSPNGVSGIKWRIVAAEGMCM